jgi:transglutaminase-like putative cysteine protease
MDPDPALAKPFDQARSAGTPFPLGEDLPHIRFTPYLRLLLEEILDGETNPLKQARKIYDFITTKVMYSFMREYAALENIAEYAAVNMKGDCGVQAILLITLCRMAGIPARWQSGLAVTKYDTGCHDWAEFYVEPWGWMFTDPSYGGSAWRMGATERWNYYFCNLDIFRMPANSAIMADFTPPKKHFRADPVDNQIGEAEYEDRGIPPFGTKTEQELISFTEG